MNIIKQQDLEFGMTNETKLLTTFRNVFDPTLKKSLNQFDPFDFRSNNCMIELKTRRIKHNQYGDMLIGANKINIARITDKDVYFVWDCVDGLWFWKFNEDDMTNGMVEYRMGGTTRRGYDETTECCFINTAVLKPLVSPI